MAQSEGLWMMNVKSHKVNPVQCRSANITNTAESLIIHGEPECFYDNVDVEEDVAALHIHRWLTPLYNLQWEQEVGV